MKIISWNYRGLGSKKKLEAMRDLIQTSNPGVLLIQETKMKEEIFLLASQKFWKTTKGVSSSAWGALAGIGTLWKKQAFDLVQYISHMHWIVSILHHKESGVQVSILNIYVPTLLSEKRIVGLVSRMS